MKNVILLTFMFAFFCGDIYARKYELFKPKYAKLILSKDKKKILTIAFDTTSKDNNDYKILYYSKKLDGSFNKIEKVSGNVKYKYHIFNVAKLLKN